VEGSGFFVGVGIDITSRKKMEEALRQSEDKYRTLLESIDNGYCEQDLAGTFTFLNDSMCRIYGYPKEELMGMNYKQYTDKESGKKCFQAYRNIYKTGEPGKVFDFEIIRKDGTKRHIESSVSLQKDSAGKRIAFRGIVRDITERKRADDALKKNREELIKKNQELEESRKNVQLTLERLGTAYEELKTTQAKILQQEKMASIGQLAAGVAHEINNPMAFIASNLGTLDKYIRRLKDFIRTQSEAIKSLKATDAIEKLEKKRKELKLDYTIDDIDLLVKESLDGSERVQKIVQELNRFSRVDDAEYKDTNINECMESSINIVWNELQHKATLHKDYGNLPPTKCYPQKLNQVFINLLINAIQAIEKKGKIKIKTWEKDGSIWVTVSDTGCGIPRENQSKIFEPFFTTKEVGKGTGLGLSISYEIMQRHKGEISFESKEGKGTAFTIRMPIV
jgi:PAS domain S-box-containing protein